MSAHGMVARAARGGSGLIVERKLETRRGMWRHLNEQDCEWELKTK